MSSLGKYVMVRNKNCLKTLVGQNLYHCPQQCVSINMKLHVPPELSVKSLVASTMWSCMISAYDDHDAAISCDQCTDRILMKHLADLDRQ